MSNDPTGEILLHPNTDEFNESDFINELVNRERRVKEYKLENDFRNNLMANLYSTIDFLKNELNENNYFIKALLYKFTLENKCCCHREQKYVETSRYQNSVTNSNIDAMKSSLTSSKQNDSWMNHTNGNVSTISNSILTSDSIAINSTQDDIKNEVSINWNDTSSSVSKNPIENQILDYRIHRHHKYVIELEQDGKKDSTVSLINEQSNIQKWPINTLLIVSDSIMNNIEEKRLSKRINVKVRAFSGSTISDMYSYIAPLLKNHPDNVLLHVGTNDGMRNINSGQIVDDLLQLKHEVELELPHCNVIISTPVVRTDNNKWNTILRNVTEKLKRLNIKLMENSNIESNQLGKKVFI